MPVYKVVVGFKSLPDAQFLEFELERVFRLGERVKVCRHTYIHTYIEFLLPTSELVIESIHTLFTHYTHKSHQSLLTAIFY